MRKYPSYKTKMLVLFLKSLGDGFPEIIYKYNKDLKPNNLKQKIRSMYEGNEHAYSEIYYAIHNCIRAFTYGEVADKSTMFSEKESSDKYWTSFHELYNHFLDFEGNFFYELYDDVFSYFIAKSFYTEISCEDYKNEEKDERLEENQRLSLKKDNFNSEEEWKSYHDWVIRCFRPEYAFSISDVRFNKKNNKTFYKWVIKEFKNSFTTKEDKNIYKEILETVFKGENGISKSFDKLKTESGKRNWQTFEKLFSNEQNDKKLWEKLTEDNKYLAAYQIFQSRMFVAFFLENFCAELQNFVKKENAEELIKIITCDVSRKKPEDFLIPDHEKKTQTMLETFKEIWSTPEDSEKNILRLIENFDKDCPATETFKAYFSLYHQSLRRKLTENQIKEAFELCVKNSFYFEESDLSNYLKYILCYQDSVRIDSTKI